LKDFEMLSWFSNIYIQPVAVLSTSEGAPGLPAGTSPAVYVKSDASVPAPPVEGLTSNQILKTTFSSVPVIWQSELAQEYQGLGEALGEMTDLDEGSEWKIDPPVYGAACFVAAGLMLSSYPAPRILNHGPKSVVFNWSRGNSNLYLTISADKVSALISSPERIQRRVEFSLNDLLNPALVLSALQPAHFEQPAVLRLTGSVSDLTDVVG
jgi:hypothetical protein